MHECINCKTDFLTKDSRNTGKYCSRECMRIYRKEYGTTRAIIHNGYRRVVWDITCRHCGCPVEAVRKTARYCSAKCQLAYEYSHGTRDKASIAMAAHAVVKLRGFPDRRGKPILQFTPEARHRGNVKRRGRQVPLLQGVHHWNWKGGVDKSVWKTPDYRAWRKAVRRRDNFTCVLCGYRKGGIIEADHIKPRYLFPELTFDVDNGRTLCKPCHIATPTYGHKVTLLSRTDFL